MMDWNCTDCERLLQAYEYATQCQLIIDHNAAVDTGLEVLVRKASNRCEDARKAVDDHHATHMTVRHGYASGPLTPRLFSAF
jgi:hypothetical protein